MENRAASFSPLLPTDAAGVLRLKRFSGCHAAPCCSDTEPCRYRDDGLAPELSGTLCPPAAQLPLACSEPVLSYHDRTIQTKPINKRALHQRCWGINSCVSSGHHYHALDCMTNRSPSCAICSSFPNLRYRIRPTPLFTRLESECQAIKYTKLNGEKVRAALNAEGLRYQPNITTGDMNNPDIISHHQ